MIYKINNLNSKILYTPLANKLLKLISWFALFMSFNNLLIGGFNISMFLFVYLIFKTNGKYKLFSINEWPNFIAILFALGAIISTIDNNSNGENSMSRSLTVLPNYIYWSFMIVVLTNILLSSKFIVQTALDFISKYIAIGVIFCMIFYAFRDFLEFPFIKNNTPNSYAFVLVCFSAIATIYVRKYYGKYKTILFISIILLSMLMLERRAGFGLVFLSTFLALNFNTLKYKTIFSIGFLSFLLFLTLQLSFVKSMLMDASPRIYESIYESENISTQDQSYLTRLAMIEKGFEIFKDNPLTGIGLNNFSNHTVNIKGNFIGSELVINKELNDKSGHNSYIAMLAEGGLLVLLPFLMLMIYNLYHFVIDFKKRTQIESAFYWSFLAMTIHIYFISEIFNVFAWFLISMVTAISIKYSRIDKMKQFS